jgi:hypothetical protein
MQQETRAQSGAMARRKGSQRVGGYAVGWYRTEQSTQTHTHRQNNTMRGCVELRPPVGDGRGVLTDSHQCRVGPINQSLTKLCCVAPTTHHRADTSIPLRPRFSLYPKQNQTSSRSKSKPNPKRLVRDEEGHSTQSASLPFASDILTPAPFLRQHPISLDIDDMTLHSSSSSSSPSSFSPPRTPSHRPRRLSLPPPLTFRTLSLTLHPILLAPPQTTGGRLATRSIVDCPFSTQAEDPARPRRPALIGQFAGRAESGRPPDPDPTDPRRESHDGRCESDSDSGSDQGPARWIVIIGSSITQRRCHDDAIHTSDWSPRRYRH